MLYGLLPVLLGIFTIVSTLVWSPIVCCRDFLHLYSLILVCMLYGLYNCKDCTVVWSGNPLASKVVSQAAETQLCVYMCTVF